MARLPRFYRESTGQRGKIQISQATADLLIHAGKTNWITPRQERVVAKGKGEMQTFWIVSESPKTEKTDQTEVSRGSFADDIYELTPILLTNDPWASAKQERLIKWNVEVLSNLLRQIEARRVPVSSRILQSPYESTADLSTNGKTILDEVQEIITLPTYPISESTREPDSVRLGSKVEHELKDYVTAIASMYRDNPFHNFEVSRRF